MAGRACDAVGTPNRWHLETGEPSRVIEAVLDEAFGLGPLEALLREPDVDTIVIQGPSDIYVESKGKRRHAETRFRGESHLLEILERIAADPVCVFDGELPRSASEKVHVTIRRRRARRMQLEMTLQTL